MPHPDGTRFKGPVRSDNGFVSGSAAVAMSAVLSGSATINPASITATTSAETAVTITGVAVGDIVDFSIPASLETGLAYSGCRVSAANTVQLRLSNFTGSDIDGASRVWPYVVLRLTAV